jgi:hypothetical protein
VLAAWQPIAERYVGSEAMSKNFQQICQSLGVGPATANSVVGGQLNLNAHYNAAGGGFPASVVIGNGPPPGLGTMHVTIYQTSWDGQGVVPFYGAAPLGPCGLHLTYTDQSTQVVRHVFYKYENGFLWCLTDGETSREKMAMKTFMETLGTHLK